MPEPTEAEKKAAADKAAEEAAAAAEAKGLVKMTHAQTKQTLRVHPTCVKDHEAVGFKPV